jgi:VWFA-related protein
MHVRHLPIRLPAVLAAAALCLLAAPMAARQQQGVFRTSTQTVPIYATVTDAQGRLVPDLVKEDFSVYDEGVLQELTVFKSDVQPITVVVMLDTSGSMTANIDLLKVAAERFALRLLPADRARIGSFSDKIIISPEFTGDRDELLRVLREDIRFGNPTFLWDATWDSMEALAPESGRRVVLVFTDGDDQISVRTGFRQVLERARNEDFMIYAIGLQSQMLGRSTRPDRNLRRLAEETGGGYFELKRTADLNTTFSRVADELHRQYVLGFSPKNLDGKVHQIEIKTRVSGMTVRARKSYLAAK